MCDRRKSHKSMFEDFLRRKYDLLIKFLKTRRIQFIKEITRNDNRRFLKTIYLLVNSSLLSFFKKCSEKIWGQARELQKI